MAQPSTPSLSAAIITISAQERRGETQAHECTPVRGTGRGKPSLVITSRTFINAKLAARGEKKSHYK